MWTVPIFTGLLSLQVGKSAGYDFLLYHYYNGYAFFTDRMNFDILPAGRGSHLNPAADVFVYTLIEHLPARLVGFILGAIHGLNFVLAAAIASCVLGPPRTAVGAVLPILLAAGGFLGAMSFGLIGSFHHDNLVSIFFLLSLLIVCRQAQIPAQTYGGKLAWQAAAGACAGAGLGLKLTLAPFVIAIGCAPLFYAWSLRRRLGAVAASAVGGLAGLLAVGGFHLVRLYSAYGNPVFPLFNRLARPPFDRFIDVRDLRYQPEGILQTLFYPFYFAFNPKRASEFLYRDFRLPVAFAVFLIFLVVIMGRYLTRQSAGDMPAQPIWHMSPAATVFLGAMAISYVGWLFIAAVYRYAVPLELLSFIVLALLLFDILGRKFGAVALLALALLILPTTQRLGIGRLPWGHEPFVETQLPRQPVVQGNAIALIVGANAGSYFIPAFPPSVRFLGIDVLDTWLPYAGEMRGPPAPESMLVPFSEMMHNIVASQRGQILGVFQSNDRDRAIDAFLRYGYAIKMQSCGVIHSNIESKSPLNLCELTPR